MDAGRLRTSALLGRLRNHAPAANRRRLASGLAALDAIVDGGIVHGRVSEITGPVGSGRTTIAMRFVAAATRMGEVVAWLEDARRFDPASALAAGAVLDRILWASPDDRCKADPESPGTLYPRRLSLIFKAAELVLKAGGFGLVVIDAGAGAGQLPRSIALRLAREAERSSAAVIVIAPHGVCGAFAALSLNLTRLKASFSRFTPASPALFEGLVIQAAVVRNKLGRVGGSALIRAAIDPAAPGFARREGQSPAAPIRRAASV
ncbi:hypothetical protein IMX07_14750 [bacterium]|nr:hypothetical protein [bacterium]